MKCSTRSLRGHDSSPPALQTQRISAKAMVTSLAAQLAQVAANSKSTLNVKAQKAAHSKSLIWEPRIAATQSYQSLYTTCHQGFEELCQLDARFAHFQTTIFSEESQAQDRTQLSKSEIEELDKQIDAFLRLVGSRLRLMPAIKSVEWLIRRFRCAYTGSREGTPLTNVVEFMRKIQSRSSRHFFPSTLSKPLRLCCPFFRLVSPPISASLTRISDHRLVLLALFLCTKLSTTRSSLRLSLSTPWSHAECSSSTLLKSPFGLA